MGSKADTSAFTEVPLHFLCAVSREILPVPLRQQCNRLLAPADSQIEGRACAWKDRAAHNHPNEDKSLD